MAPSTDTERPQSAPAIGDQDQFVKDMRANFDWLFLRSELDRKGFNLFDFVADESVRKPIDDLDSRLSQDGKYLLVRAFLANGGTLPPPTTSSDAEVVSFGFAVMKPFGAWSEFPVIAREDARRLFSPDKILKETLESVERRAPFAIDLYRKINGLPVDAPPARLDAKTPQAESAVSVDETGNFSEPTKQTEQQPDSFPITVHLLRKLTGSFGVRIFEYDRENPSSLPGGTATSIPTLKSLAMPNAAVRPLYDQLQSLHEVGQNRLREWAFLYLKKNFAADLDKALQFPNTQPTVP